MDLRRRLAELGSPFGGRPAEPASQEPHREQVLTELRERMARILGRELPPPRPASDPSQSELPFVLQDTDDGPLCQRLSNLPASHHVGRMPVDSAHAAEAELLALLALDPKLSTVDPRRALYLDTETTGLGGGAGVVAFLVGMAYFNAAGRLILEQLLLRRPGEELPLLLRVAERVSQAGVLVTYNGKTFDLPLLQTRMVMNRLPPLPERPHLDLLHVARRLHRSRLGVCRLVSLESEVLGFERGDDIDGAEVAPRYSHYLRTGDERALAGVVDHNAYDVVSMAALVGLYGEPLGLLHADDLVGMARTLKRARALEVAEQVADHALVRGAGPEALRVRGQIHKARGDKARALKDFEALARELPDDGLRLELCKLYEHHVKEPMTALEWLDKGTGEDSAAVERRRARLERKIAKRSAPGRKSRR